MNLLAWLCEIIRRDVLPAVYSTGAEYVSANGFVANKNFHVAVALPVFFLSVVLARRWVGKADLSQEASEEKGESTICPLDSYLDFDVSIQVSIKGRKQWK